MWFPSHWFTIGDKIKLWTKAKQIWTQNDSLYNKYNIIDYGFLNDSHLMFFPTNYALGELHYNFNELLNECKTAFNKIKYPHKFYRVRIAHHTNLIGME